MMRKLNKYGYEGSLILEISMGSTNPMSEEEWLADVYARLKRISEMG